MAHPQIGLEDADVVYIEQVEGGLTRLAAVFSSTIPVRIGPVRSARISDIDILSQYGRVAFAYSGAQRKLLPVITAANLQDLGDGMLGMSTVGLKAGMYFLRLSTQDTMHLIKFTVIH